MKNINSLKNTAEFRQVYEGGKSFANRLLVVYVLKKDGPLRIGISVSKKVGNSVGRHRVTRLIRESFLSVKHELPDNLWIVVVARPFCGGKTENEVEKALRHALMHHKVLKNG